ncbi:cyclic nucleotide-binding domain-containing protein [Aquibacillus halophilus]|uniref:Cyclic nucleotide-binding domain-containing protein n=1 Tax=Aquibacillus halophilus TaxID=930132 RepID=A0A6A8DTG1_9BACI|nr:cyclic nucleotide-binding domain-containing protein [Aquibacillus halophilus]MRH44512.1 cyclic nucleotide-binding domain-containing protein [Aquibacillus halophilus]
MKSIALDLKQKGRKNDIMNLEEYGIAVQKNQSERIYTPEQSTNAAFYLTEGFVRLVNQQNCITKVIGSREFFGDRSIFSSENIYAEALTNIKYVRIDESSYKRLMDDNVELTMDITSSISKHYAYLQKEQTLLSRSKELFGHMKRGHSLLPLLINWKKDCSICLN